jgi:gamma-D-glutamyl-L-lysine dipeptidyl-peptidase
VTDVAVVRAAIAPLHAEARVSSAQISQRLAGHAVTVLFTEGDWMRVRGEDEYEGWMHRGYADLPAEPAASSDERRLSLGCVVRNRETDWSRALPLGAWLRPSESVVTGDALDAAARDLALPRDPAAIASTAAERFAGTSYQWGGISPWGADCSGIVQTAFWLHGVILPRDAWQQAAVGRDAGSRMSEWNAADLLFFTDRADERITHVGISLGGARMVHLGLARGGYALEHLDSREDAYVTSLMSRFVTARRVI